MFLLRVLRGNGLFISGLCITRRNSLPMRTQRIGVTQDRSKLELAIWEFRVLDRNLKKTEKLGKTQKNQ